MLTLGLGRRQDAEALEVLLLAHVLHLLLALDLLALLLGQHEWHGRRRRRLGQRLQRDGVVLRRVDLRLPEQSAQQQQSVTESCTSSRLTFSVSRWLS